MSVNEQAAVVLRLKDRLMAAVYELGRLEHINDVPQEMVRALLIRAQELHLAVRHEVPIGEPALAAALASLEEFEAWRKARPVVAGTRE